MCCSSCSNTPRKHTKRHTRIHIHTHIDTILQGAPSHLALDHCSSFFRFLFFIIFLVFFFCFLVLVLFFLFFFAHVNFLAFASFFFVCFVFVFGFYVQMYLFPSFWYCITFTLLVHTY